MSTIDALLLLSSFVFAVNMGGSGLAPSFAAALGAGVVPRRWAVVLFGVFVTVGALSLGKFVAKTLGSGLVPAEDFAHGTALCVIASATVALLLANLLKIPQSTSWVTVSAIATVGLVRADLNTDTILYRLVPAWIGLPLLSFVLTGLLLRPFYPLRGGNLRAFEWLSRHQRSLGLIVLATSCYVATAIGSNNVANVVGPLAAAGVVDVTTGFLVAAPLFALGALVFRSPAETIGRKIVPLGLVTAAVANLVTASVLLCASWLGIPQSLVHINAASVAAVSLAKEGAWQMMRRDQLGRIGLTWLATPAIAAALTLTLLLVVN